MFELPPEGQNEPAAIYNRLLERDGHFEHLREWKPDVAFLMRRIPERSGQRRVIGTCSMPTVQGRHRNMFEWLVEDKLGYLPVFLFVLDHEWWSLATPRLREILMFHEMHHAGVRLNRDGEPCFKRETGEPVWAIVSHDVEEFTAVVARYGAWDQDLRDFKAALLAEAGQ